MESSLSAKLGKTHTKNTHTMTVKELIQQLQQHDPDTRVVVNGYEGGLGDLEDLEKVKIELNVNTEWYYGPHEITYKTNRGLDALLINGIENS